MQASAAHPTVVDVVDMLLEFWEAAVHAILAARGLYRPDLFTRERLYGLAVQRARHPGLCAYIANALQELRVMLLRSCGLTVGMLSPVDVVGGVQSMHAGGCPCNLLTPPRHR